MEHFPSPILVLMGAFAACFKANNFVYFQGFMLSYMLLGQTRKCVTTVLTGLISDQLNPLGFIADSMGSAQLMNFWDTVCPMTVQLKGMPGPVPVRTAADACFSKAPFISRMLSEGVHVISRMRWDAVGWDDPEPIPPGK